MSVMIKALDDEKARVWIDSEAVSSPDHVLSDFDYMDIGDLELTNGVSLKAGVYAKTFLELIFIMTFHLIKSYESFKETYYCWFYIFNN